MTPEFWETVARGGRHVHVGSIRMTRIGHPDSTVPKRSCRQRMSWADRIEELKFPQIKVVEVCSAWGAQHAIDGWEERGYTLDSLSASTGSVDSTRVTILFRRQWNLAWASACETSM
jgi:hypothetical protein